MLEIVLGRGATLAHGNCQSILLDEKRRFNLVFLDPPFNKGIKYGGKSQSDEMDAEAYYEMCHRMIYLSKTVLAPHGVIALMTIVEHLPRMFASFEGLGMRLVGQVIWRNVTGTHNKRMFWRSYQPILIYALDAEYTFHQYAERRTASQMRTVGGFPSSWGKKFKPQGQLLDYWEDIPYLYAGNNTHPEVIFAAPKKGKKAVKRKAHPCQLPTRLPGRLIKFFTNPGDRVLDPFAGSGSTLLAAARLERESVGIEIVGPYCDLIRQRFNNGELDYGW